LHSGTFLAGTWSIQAPAAFDRLYLSCLTFSGITFLYVFLSLKSYGHKGFTLIELVLFVRVPAFVEAFDIPLTIYRSFPDALPYTASVFCC